MKPRESFEVASHYDLEQELRTNTRFNTSLTIWGSVLCTGVPVLFKNRKIYTLLISKLICQICQEDIWMVWLHSLLKHYGHWGNDRGRESSSGFLIDVGQMTMCKCTHKFCVLPWDNERFLNTGNIFITSDCFPLKIF